MRKNNKNILLIVLVLVIVLALGVFLYKSIWKESPFINDFKSCEKIGGNVMESYPRQCSFDGMTFVEELPVNEKAQTYCNKENVAQVDVCGNYVAVTSSLLGGGITYYKEDGTSFSCPVVGPDSMSPECKDIFEKKVAETFECVNVC